MKITRKLMLAGGLLTAARLGQSAWRFQQRPLRKQALRGQVAVITGASSGIGKALAETLADAGCRLVLAARRVELLESLAAGLESFYGIETLVVRTDIAEPEQAQVLIERAIEHFGQIDLLINNAGIADYTYFNQDSIESMRRVMDVNYWGTVACTKAALPPMRARRKGMIVNISSVAGKIGQAGIANYSASKHAVNGLSEALRIEEARHGVRVLLVCPTSTKTDIVKNSSNHSGAAFNPESYFGMSAERVARETLRAILDRRRELVLGAGERLGLGIHAVAPGFVDTVMKQAVRFIFKE
jgi:short-subunit dehydrogenase